MGTTRNRLVITHRLAEKKKSKNICTCPHWCRANCILCHCQLHHSCCITEPEITVTQAESAASSFMSACSSAHIQCSIILWQPAQHVGCRAALSCTCQRAQQVPSKQHQLQQHILHLIQIEVLGDAQTHCSIIQTTQHVGKQRSVCKRDRADMWVPMPTSAASVPYEQLQQHIFHH